jgi:hypothetical protein
MARPTGLAIRTLSTVVLGLLLAAPADATTWTVCCCGPTIKKGGS